MFNLQEVSGIAHRRLVVCSIMYIATTKDEMTNFNFHGIAPTGGRVCGVVQLLDFVAWK